MRFVLSLLLLTALCAPAPRSRAADDDASPDEIKKLIRQLGDDEFARREAASKRLKAIGKPALKALKVAAANPDPEIAARAQGIIRRIEIRPLPGMDPNIANGRLAVAGRVSVGVVDGKRVLEVNEGGREIKLTVDDDGGLVMSVTGWTDGQRVTEEYAAKDAEQLKAENPEAHALFERWSGVGGRGVFMRNVNPRLGLIQMGPPVVLDELDQLRARLERQMRDGNMKEADRAAVNKGLDQLVAARTDRLPNTGMERYTEQCDAFRKVLEQHKLDAGELLPPPANARLGVSIGGEAGRLFVKEIAEKSRATRIGLKADDVIRKVDGKEIATVTDLRKAVAAKTKGLVVEITRDGQEMKLTEKDEAPEKEKGTK
jgi:hypothetical protein